MIMSAPPQWASGLSGNLPLIAKSRKMSLGRAVRYLDIYIYIKNINHIKIYGYLKTLQFLIPYHTLPYLTISYHTLPITYLPPVTFWALYSGAPTDSCSPKNCMSWWPRCVDALASSQVGGFNVPEKIWQVVLTIDSIVVNNEIKWSSEFFGK